jgi:hypothetical protein
MEPQFLPSLGHYKAWRWDLGFLKCILILPESWIISLQYVQPRSPRIKWNVLTSFIKSNLSVSLGLSAENRMHYKGNKLPRQPRPQSFSPEMQRHVCNLNGGYKWLDCLCGFIFECKHTLNHQVQIFSISKHKLPPKQHPQGPWPLLCKRLCPGLCLLGYKSQ